MNISKERIISNSGMTKNYKAGREKAERAGKIFVLKNDQPDAVLFSINEYERIAVLIEYLESYEGKDVAAFTESFPKKGNRITYSIDNLRNDIK